MCDRRKQKVLSVVFRYIFLALTAAVCVAIFIFSSQTGRVSTQRSVTIAEKLAPSVIKDFDSIPENKRAYKTKLLELDLRSYAHEAEFSALSFFSGGFALTFSAPLSDALSRMKAKKKGAEISPSEEERKKKKRFPLFAFSFAAMLFCSFSFAALYAVLDEFHQKFVPGRSFQISDIAKDLKGALIGTLAVGAIFAAVYFVLHLRGKHPENIKKEKRNAES